ncbi:rRNA-processing protein UTP23-like protein, partial [Stegodyphus mimosarum]
MLIVKQFLVRKCGHEKNPLPASDCLLSMTENGNPDHYILATQDRELSEKVRLIPGIPLLYISHNAINLEKPSVVNKETIQVKMQEKLKSSDYQNAVLNKLKREIFGNDDEPKRKKKKIKGPNPLSCKKKKERPVAPQNEKTKKRKRHKRSKNKEVHVPPLLSCLE